MNANASTADTAAPRPGLGTIAASILGILTLGFVSGYLAGPDGAGGWYEALAKPDLTPPQWVFPVAWTLLYAVTGYAIARVWAAPSSAARTGALVAFAAQLALNLAWSPVFFGLRALDLAVWVTVALFAAAAYAAWRMARVDATAGVLMTPYLAWVGFALWLTASIAGAN